MTMLLEPFGFLFETPRQRQLRTDRSRAFIPAADVVTSEDEMTLVMDVPGFKSEDLAVELRDRVLRVRGERRYPYATDGSERSIQRLERGFGRFERALQVPEGVDPSALAASIEDGVLTVRIPLPEARKPHRIEIRSGEAQRVIDAEWSTDGGHQEPGDDDQPGDDDRGDRELATASS